MVATCPESRLKKLARTTSVIGLGDVLDAAVRLLKEGIQGRTVVDVNA